MEICEFKKNYNLNSNSQSMFESWHYLLQIQQQQSL